MSTSDGNRQYGDKVRKQYRGQQRSVNRSKRAVVACNQCRKKRIKCQNDEFGTTCQNCVRSRSTCEYSDSIFLQNWLDHENALSQNHPGGDSRKTYSIQGSMNLTADDGFRAELPRDAVSSSQENRLFESNDSFASDKLDIEADSRDNTVQDREVNDGLDKSLIHYLVPLITGCNFETPVSPPPMGHVDLPELSLLKSAVNAYFAHVAPVYPILDQKLTIDHSELLAPVIFKAKSPSNLLLKMLMCTGAACMNDQDIQGYDIKNMRECVFSQVLSESQLIHQEFGIVNIQIMVLITIYCWQTERLNTAWHWCGWAIRKTYYLGVGLGQEKMLENKERVDFLKWNLFILESQLSLLQFRDDSKLKSENIEEPSAQLSMRHPVFFFRVTLARLVNKFSLSKGPERQQSPISFQSCLKDIAKGMNTLKESVPLEWRPEHEILTDPAEHPCVFALHLEYHMLHMQIFTSRKAHAKMVTRYMNIRNKEVDIERAKEDHITSYTTSARKILQILGGIRASPRLNTTMRWMSLSIHVLGAFQVLYAFVIQRPRYISASSDVQLLGSACYYLESGMANLSQGPEILAVIQMMQGKALMEIHNASGSCPSNPEASCSSNIITTNISSMTQTTSHEYESLLFGYNFSDIPEFYEIENMETSLEVGNEADCSQLGHQVG